MDAQGASIAGEVAELVKGFGVNAEIIALIPFAVFVVVPASYDIFNVVDVPLQQGITPAPLQYFVFHRSKLL